jgi:hypothetical protein
LPVLAEDIEITRNATPQVNSKNGQLSIKGSTMKKLIIAAFTATALLGTSAAAYAGWYDAYGYYHQTCGWVYTYNGPVYVCD